MACVEHECLSAVCGWYGATNTTVQVCPQCGGRTLSTYDEVGDRDDSADDE